jgi:ABC-2 type transport system permease protein
VARLFVQLKLRLLLGALRGSKQIKTAFILSLVAACLFAAGTFIGLAAMRGNASAVDLTTVTFTSYAFGWLILPLLVFGLDGTLDPSTLALYPLRLRPLAVGLLAASCVGAWPLANLLGLLGTTVGLAHGVFGILVAVLAVVMQLLFCMVLARAVTTGLAGMLRSRRGKDFAGFLIVPIFALYEFFVQVVPKVAAEGKLTGSSFHSADDVLRWTPPGLAAHAIQDASTGHAVDALLRLALLAAVIVVLGAAWIRSLGRALVTVDTTTQSAVVHGSGLPFAGRPGLRSTVAARVWVYQRREPGAMIFWAIVVVISCAVSASTVLTPAYLGAVFGSVGMGSAFVGVFGANVFGMTGPAFVFEAMTLTDRRSLRGYFAGVDLATSMVALPVLVVVGFGISTLAKHPVDGFLSMATVFAGVGAAMGLSNVFAATLPYPVEKRAGSPSPKAMDGYKGQVLAGAFGSVIGVAVAVTPVVLAAVFTRSVADSIRMPALVLCAAVYGLALAALGVRIAARAAEGRLPELVQTASRSVL